MGHRDNGVPAYRGGKRVSEGCSGALFAVTLLVGGATSALADDGDSTVILSNAHMAVSQDGDWTRYDYDLALDPRGT